MKYGEWLPFCIGAIICATATVLCCFLPETLHSKDAPELADDRLEDADSSGVVPNYSGKGDVHGHGFKGQFYRLRETLSFLKTDASLTMAVLTFLVNRLARQSQDLIVRYASKRYDWTIRQVCHINFVIRIMC
jgi:hypothetical protein